METKPKIGQKVLCFDLFADYAQIKTYYTTMSPLSFAIPTGTMLRGLLGALTGIEKEKAPEYFHEVDLAVELLNPVEKINIPENLLKTVKMSHFSRFDSRKPTNIEFVKNPRYRIYITTDNADIYADIEKHLKEHTSVYTLSLGISEALANFENVESTSVKAASGGIVPVASMVPTDAIHDVRFEDSEVFTATIPVKMKNDREVIEYREFAYERSGKPVYVETNQTKLLGNGKHVIFF
jgi:CRISPR-associated protein Cas5h